MLLAGVAYAILAQGPKGESGIVYGYGAGLCIAAPKGWVLDNQAGKTNGLDAVLYAKDSSWDKAKTVMYVKFDEKKGRSFKTYIADDKAQFKKHDDRKITALPNLTTHDKKTATVIRFDSNSGRQHDLVAYLDLPKAFAMVVLTSWDSAGATANRKPFEALVKSAFAMDVTVAPQKKKA